MGFRSQRTDLDGRTQRSGYLKQAWRVLDFPVMGTNRQHEDLPRYVKWHHNAYYYYRWNPETQKPKWTWLGKTRPDMYRALALLESGSLVTMAEVLDRYKAEVSDLQSANTRRQRTWQLAKLRKSFGGMRPDAITTEHLYRYLEERTQSGAPVAANRELSLLSSVFRKAIRWRYVKTNPVREIERNPERPRDRYVTDAEFDAVLKTAPAPVRNAMMLAYLTGQRIGDLLALKWEHIDADGVHFRQQKTGKRLIIEISPTLQRVLDDCKGIESDYVLCNRHGTPWTGFSMSARFRRHVAKVIQAGEIKESFTFHDLRARAASDSDGSLLGHNDPRTLHRYYKRKPFRAKPVK